MAPGPALGARHPPDLVETNIDPVSLFGGWPTPALTRGPRRARALSADLITRLRPRASKARDRPDRRVERVVMGRGCLHDHNLYDSSRVPRAATNNAVRCAVECHRNYPDHRAS